MQVKREGLSIIISFVVFKLLYCCCYLSLRQSCDVEACIFWWDSYCLAWVVAICSLLRGNSHLFEPSAFVSPGISFQSALLCAIYIYALPLGSTRSCVFSSGEHLQSHVTENEFVICGNVRTPLIADVNQRCSPSASFTSSALGLVGTYT